MYANAKASTPNPISAAKSFKKLMWLNDVFRMRLCAESDTSKVGSIIGNPKMLARVVEFSPLDAMAEVKVNARDSESPAMTSKAIKAVVLYTEISKNSTNRVAAMPNWTNDKTALNTIFERI